MFVKNQRFDVIFTDQVSVTNLAVYMFQLARKKHVFYCHYPDVLLCTNRESILKRWYRAPFDWLERRTTNSFCDVLLVNSKYTAQIVKSTFGEKISMEVLYPPVDTTRMVKGTHAQYFLSLNRFERKKDLELALTAFADLRSTRHELIIAGGYDPRLDENVNYFEHLQRQITILNLQERVKLIQNVSDEQRSQLLANAIAVIYTPQFEHFGIVPVEAMLAGTPVIAWNNGGPKESIQHNQTGYLCNQTSEFTAYMQTIIDRKPNEITQMSKKCNKRVNDLFSLKSFTDRLVYIINKRG